MMARRVLVVGGSETEREHACRALSEAGYESECVADGAEAFEQMMALPYDLVVTDCTLPRLECSAMLAKLRGMGVKTPVLVWAASPSPERLACIETVTVGFVDKNEPIAALVARVQAILSGDVGVAQNSPTPTPAPVDNAHPARGGILLISERESDASILRGLLPPSMHFVACTTPNLGLAHAHDHRFDLVLLSVDTKITNLTGVLAQMHLMLPHSFILGVTSVAHGQSPQAALKALEGLDFDEVALWPFTQSVVNRLLDRYCSPWEDLVVVADDLVRASARCSRREFYKEFAADMKSRLEQGVRVLIDACFDRAVVDVSAVDALTPMDLAEVLRRLRNCATPLGVSVRFVVSQAAVGVLRKLEASFGWDPFELYPSIDEARTAQA
jgi:CheY-like chemotaxis protein